MAADSHVCSSEQWLLGGFHGDFLLSRYPDLKARDGPNIRAETREGACSLPVVTAISHEGAQTYKCPTLPVSWLFLSTLKLKRLRC